MVAGRRGAVLPCFSAHHSCPGQAGPQANHPSHLAGLGLFSFVACIVISQRNPSTAFYLFPFRAWELLLGVLLAVYENGGRASLSASSRWLPDLLALIGIALLAFSIFGFGAHTVFPGYAAATPCLGSLLLISSPASWINRRILTRFCPSPSSGRSPTRSYLLRIGRFSASCRSPQTCRYPDSTGSHHRRRLEQFSSHGLPFISSSSPFAGPPLRAPGYLSGNAVCCALVMLPALVFRVSGGLPGRFAGIPHGALLGRGVDDRRCAVDFDGSSAPAPHQGMCRRR